jgi:glycogen debranching enzyme
MDTLIEEARQRALEVLRQCATELGFKASAHQRGYPHVWARDAAITSLGAGLTGDPDLLAAVRGSLDTLTWYQTELGLIPLNVSMETRTISTENAGAVDSNLWYLLHHLFYYRLTQEADYVRRNWAAIDRALLWLRYQDMNECGLLEVPEAGDWMDLLAVRYNVLYDNVLWYAALRAYAVLAEVAGQTAFRERALQMAAGVHERLNLLMWIDRHWDAAQFAERLERLKAMRLEWYMLYHNVGTISSRPYYLPYVAFREYGDYCDVLGNLLAILCNIADLPRSDSIIRYLYQVGVAQPYPTKAIHPVIFPGQADWREYYRSRNLNLPHQYHNGGIWPMIGGFHIAALVRTGWHTEAASLLRDLAEACRLGVREPWEFNEWLHGQTGHPMGYACQGWSAGMFLYAYEAVRTGHTPLFDELGG